MVQFTGLKFQVENLDIFISTFHLPDRFLSGKLHHSNRLLGTFCIASRKILAIINSSRCGVFIGLSGLSVVSASMFGGRDMTWVLLESAGQCFC